MAATRLVAILLVGVLSGAAAAQNCGCASGLCCSMYGYCGTGNHYCGEGCRAGPCHSSSSSSSLIGDIVTQSFWDKIIINLNESCDGSSFYTRAAFLSASVSYPKFGSEGSTEDNKREIAAFFAHVTYETEGFCLIEEIDGALRDYCVPDLTNYPCVAGQKYYGRGPFQLRWNFNYGAAGQSIGVNGLSNPGIVGTDPVVSFKTALWFWMESVHSVMEQGFGATIRAISSYECDGGNNVAAGARWSYYEHFCTLFGVSTTGPGDFNNSQVVVHIF